jgi:hypothetical protein
MGIPVHDVRVTGVPPVFMGKDAHATRNQKRATR